MYRVLVVDTECTDKKGGEIIELAYTPLREYADGSMSWRANTLASFFGRFKPSKPSTFGAIAVHHILDSDLEGAPPSSDAKLPDGVEYVIGHSVDFDWEALGRPAVKRICTHAIATHVWQDNLGHSLVSLMYRLLGVNGDTRNFVRNAHTASGDVAMTVLLLAEIMRQNPGLTSWESLWEYSEECRIPLTCPHKRYEGVKLEDLDDGYIRWCLDLWDLDPYYRKGLERVLENRGRIGSVSF